MPRLTLQTDKSELGTWEDIPIEDDVTLYFKDWGPDRDLEVILAPDMEHGVAIRIRYFDPYGDLVGSDIYYG